MTLEELRQIVGKFRLLHKVNGAIIVTFEPGRTLHAYAFADPDVEALNEGVPIVLRQIADAIESGRDTLKLEKFRPE